jgi:hypothetical protein
MKKLISILSILIMFASIAGAQTAIDFRVNDTDKIYTGVAGDTLNSSYTLTKNIFVGKNYFYHVNVQVEADSLGDGTDITARLRGSWDNSTWYNIGSPVAWAVTTADTTFSINDFAITETYSAFNAITDTTGDTLAYPARTITKSVEGLMYPYLQVYFLGGGAGADMKLKKLTVRIVPVK